MQGAQSHDAWEQVAPCLDEALAQLSEIERNAVLLHYFQHKRLREVGQSLGVSEDAAEKRVARAVEKLRKLMLKRRVALPVVVIPGLLMTHGAQVPPAGLAGSVAAAALGKTAVPASVFALLQLAFRVSLWPKVSPILTKAAAVVVVALLAGLTVRLWPTHARDRSPAYSFSTEIVRRARVARLHPLPQQTAAPAATQVASGTTNAGPGLRVAVTPPPPVLTNSLPEEPKVVSELETPNAQPGPVQRLSTWAAPTGRAWGRDAGPSPTDYQMGYPVAVNGIPLPRWQPVFYPGLVGGLGRQRSFLQPTQPAFYSGSAAPWMPMHRAAVPSVPKPWSSPNPTKKRP